MTLVKDNTQPEIPLASVSAAVIEPAIKIYTDKDEIWTNETGVKVPYSRVNKRERIAERMSVKLHKDSLKVNAALAALKDLIADTSENIFNMFMKEHEIKEPGKGNFTWYSFDRSIMIERSINERIDFDEMFISACKAKLDEYLGDIFSEKEEAVISIIKDAFATSRGKLDAKKVLGLLRYRTKIKAHKFQEALNLLEQSIRRPDSKTYYRIAYRQSDNSYKYIDLNFSSI